MKKIMYSMIICFCVPLFAQESVAVIKQKMIEESIASYPGNCPCPYNSARNGSSCGKRSAWSKGGGYSPLCYESDITKEMVREYRETHTHK